MVASLKFESAAGTAAATLAEVKLVTLADNTDNKYTLDITTDDLKVAYTPNGGQAKEYTVNGLAAALGKLLTIDGSTPGKSVLAEEVAKKPVVEAIFNAQDLTDPANPINVAETKIGATFAKIDGSNVEEAGVIAMLGKLTPANQVAKIDGSNVEEAGVNTMLGKLPDKVVKTSELSSKAADKAVVEAIFNAQDGKKSILVNKLGEALDRVQDNADDKVYGDVGQEKIAKDFLGEKGLKPLPSEVASELIAKNKQDLADEVANNPGLQTAVANNAGLKAVLANPSSIAAISALQEAVAKNADLQEAVAKNGDLQKAVAAIPALQTAVAENVDLQEAVAENVDFREAVAMDNGLKTAVAMDADLRTAVAADAGLRTAVANNANLKAILAKPADIAAIPALQTAVAADAGLQAAVAGTENLQKL